MEKKSRKKRIRCMGCGKLGMKLTDVKGRTFPYKQYDVELGVTVTLLACPSCNNIALTPGDCKALDEAIEKTLAGVKNENPDPSGT